MAEVMSRTDLISPCGHRSFPLSRKRTNPSVIGFPRSCSFKSMRSSSLDANFNGSKLVIEDLREKITKGNPLAIPVIKMGLSIGKAMRWWDKGLQPNMKEIKSAHDLVDSLLKAGNKLVVVDFFSPGCGGCKALHPKICQFAEMNPDVIFLSVNYEEHKSMCYSLKVHVLPFFKFYRGAHGRLCSFSCTNATIKKFRDAMAKHTTDRCSLGPAKGLEESELMELAANKDLNFDYRPKTPAAGETEEQAASCPNHPPAIAPALIKIAMTAAGR